MNVVVGMELHEIAMIRSPKKARLLRMVADGYDNITISMDMKMSVQTVKNEVRDIYARLGIDEAGRNQRVVFARWWEAVGQHLPVRDKATEEASA